MCNSAIVFSAFALKESTDPSTVFFNFCSEIRQHGWKERVKISNVAKSESDCWKVMKTCHRKVVKFYRRFHGGEHVRSPPPPPPPKQTTENVRNLVG